MKITLKDGTIITFVWQIIDPGIPNESIIVWCHHYAENGNVKICDGSRWVKKSEVKCIEVQVIEAGQKRCTCKERGCKEEPCKGECGCPACHESYMDFLSEE